MMASPGFGAKLKAIRRQQFKLVLATNGDH